MTFAKRDAIATWVAFCIAVLLALPQPPNPLYVAVGAILGALFTFLGFSATTIRTVVPRPWSQRLKFAVLSLVFGAILGSLLLAILIMAARAEPALHARFSGRADEAWWRPWALAFESSILEEVVFRLLIMSVVAWAVFRLSRRERLSFAIGLAVSALAFGLAHLPPWLSLAHGTAILIATVLLLNGIGGVLFGSIFWRWGLPYAIACHFAGDVVIQTVAPKLLG